MSSAWQQTERLDVTDSGGTATFTLRYNTPLERLTIWAVSGARVLEDVVLQPQLNGINFGSPANIVAAVAADLVYNSGGSAHENAILPMTAAGVVPGSRDPFVFSVLVTNNGADPIKITLIAVATTHT